MHYRTLGNSTLSVSAIGLGLMSMSGVYGKGDDAESIAVVHKALDLGVNFVDSSDMYGWGQTRAARPRDQGQARSGRAHHQVRPGPEPGRQGEPRRRQPRPRGAAVTRLKRLGVDVIDLYSQHRVDPKVPIEDTVGAMARAGRQGKVRYIGLSEAAPATSPGRTPCIPSPPCRPSTRSSTGTRPEGDAAHLPRRGIFVRRRTRRSAGAF